MQVPQRFAVRPLAATLSLSGVIVLLIASRLLITPFVVVGFVVLSLNLLERPGRGMALAEIVGALATWGFTTFFFTLAYAEFVRRDVLEALPELYASTVATSLAGLLMLAGGILDWTRRPRRTEDSR